MFIIETCPAALAFRKRRKQSHHHDLYSRVEKNLCSQLKDVTAVWVAGYPKIYLESIRPVTLKVTKSNSNDVFERNLILHNPGRHTFQIRENHTSSECSALCLSPFDSRMCVVASCYFFTTSMLQPMLSSRFSMMRQHVDNVVANGVRFEFMVFKDGIETVLVAPEILRM